MGHAVRAGSLVVVPCSGGRTIRICDAGLHLRPVKWEPPVSLRGVGIEAERMRVNRAGGTRPFRPSRSRAALLPVLRVGQMKILSRRDGRSKPCPDRRAGAGFGLRDQLW